VGVTNQANGKLECWPHNRDALKHDHGRARIPNDPSPSSTRSAARLRWRHNHEDDEGGDDGDTSDQPAA
jgi:hypothetical protein